MECEIILEYMTHILMQKKLKKYLITIFPTFFPCLLGDAVGLREFMPSRHPPNPMSPQIQRHLFYIVRMGKGRQPNRLTRVCGVFVCVGSRRETKVGITRNECDNTLLCPVLAQSPLCHRNTGQSEASNQVTWSRQTNQRPVSLCHQNRLNHCYLRTNRKHKT